MTRLEKLLIRESDPLDCEQARLGVGRDGRVYISAWVDRPIRHHLLSMTTDGGDRRGIVSSPDRNTTLGYVTATATGYVARTEPHEFPGIPIFNPQGEQIAFWPGSILVRGGRLDVPARVEAGDDNRFYVLAQAGVPALKPTDPDLPQAHILDLGDPAAPSPLTRYPLPFPETAFVLDFRVRVFGGVPTFAVLYVDSAKTTWIAVLKAGATAPTWQKTDADIAKLAFFVKDATRPTQAGGFDFGDDGQVYLIPPDGNAISTYGPSGRTTTIPLADNSNPVYRELRMWRNRVIVQHKSDRELFAVYQINGTQSVYERSVNTHYDVLTADIPDEQPWTAGTSVPITLTLNRSIGGFPQRITAPAWRVFGRSPEAQDHREYQLTATADPTRFQLAVPADVAGLVQLTFSADTGPFRTGTTPDFRVQRIVEIRVPGHTGTVSLATLGRSLNTYGNSEPITRPTNRTRYALGEPIELQVTVRQATAAAKQLTIRLDDATTGQTVAKTAVTVPIAATEGSLDLILPPEVTAFLRPGRYVLTAEAPGFTIAVQRLEIGPGKRRSGHRRVWFADITPQLFPGGTDSNAPVKYAYLDMPDVLATHLDRVRLLGWTIVTDRLGINTGAAAVYGPAAALQPLVTAEITRRMEADRTAVAPGKIVQLNSLLSQVTGLGALGAEQRAVFLGNDAILPLGDIRIGTANDGDGRRPITRFRMLSQLTDVLLAYRGFSAWQWTANSWPRQSTIDNVLYYPYIPPPNSIVPDPNNDDLAKAYKDCVANGTWSPLLGAMAGNATMHLPNTHRQLRQALLGGFGERAKRLVNPGAAPFYQGNVYPPLTYQDMDEIDIQAQWEQFPLFLHTAFAVDFHGRPGKPLTIHPQNNNDGGTGEQSFGQAFAALLRGSPSTGHAELVPTFRDRFADPRVDTPAVLSNTRVLADFVHEYGGWLAKFGADDRVAILLSRRQFAVQSWPYTLPSHLRRVYEAWLACLYAGAPASLVFVEDLGQPGVRALTEYRAVLLVDERTEFDTDVRAALAQVTMVYHDGSSRDTVVAGTGSKPLGTSFDQWKKLFEAQDDSAYREWRRIALYHKDKLSQKLKFDVVTCADPDVLLSERVSGNARIVMALNNSPFDVDPAFLRRASQLTALTAPIPPTKLTLPTVYGGKAVYDVIAGKQLTVGTDGTVTADFRHWPMAIFALLPQAITGVGVTSSLAGNRLKWTIQIQGAADPVPVRVRVLDDANAVLWEGNAVSPSTDSIAMPANAQGQLRVEVVELLSGKSAISYAGTPQVTMPFDLLTAPASTVKAPVAGTAPVTPWTPAAQRLGVRTRTVAVSGTMAVLSTANWDTNLVGLDLATGAVKWQNRVGHHFTFSPQAVTSAVAVRGTVLDSPNGYGLHLVDPATGAVQRRFDQHGTLPRWNERITNADHDGHPPAFATPPSGSWVASAGNVGISVWRKDGTPLWSTETWTLADQAGAPSDAHIVALSEDSLLVVHRGDAVCYQVAARVERWRRKLPGVTVGARATASAVSPDGKLVAVATTYEGGTLYLLSAAGDVVASLPAEVDELAWSADSKTLLNLRDTRVELYRDRTGWSLDRSYAGRDVLRNLAVSPDGRIALGDEQGRLVVLDANANPVWESDFGSLAAPAWLSGGDLLVATWLGRVSRLAGTGFQPRWSTLVTSIAADMRTNLLAPQTAQVTRTAVVGNAEPLPATPPANLLKPDIVSIEVWVAHSPRAQAATFDEPNLLSDNSQPRDPWLTDGVNDYLAQEFVPTWIQFTTTADVTFNALTLRDDPAHPESWLRDTRLEIRTGPNAVWRPVARLISDRATRLHRVSDTAKPITTRQFRLALPPGVYGNIRLAGFGVHLL